MCVFEALEPILKETAGKYCVGDEVMIVVYFSKNKKLMQYLICAIVQTFGVSKILKNALLNLKKSRHEIKMYS